jgi:hypothetical protein
MAAPGEAILNRHQQAPVNAALEAVYGFNLDGLFARVQTPHYMAKGGNVEGRVRGPGKVAAIGHGALGKVFQAAQQYLNAHMPSGPALFGGKTPAGVGSFDGMPVDKWIIPILAWATRHGWHGSVTSGYRSRAEQEALYANPQGYPVAAPGTSNHEKVAYPGGAVDVTSPEQLAAVLSRYPRRPNLVWGGPVIGDAPHFSATGHARGGWVRFAKGGRIPSWAHGSSTLSADQLATLAHYVGAPNPGLMSQIAQAESGGNPHAMGGAGDKGLWQIIPSTAAAFGINYGSLFDPLANAIGMKKIVEGQGLGAWSTYNSGAYSGYPKGHVSPLGGTGASTRSGGARGASHPTPHYTTHLGSAKAAQVPGLGPTPLLPSAKSLPKSIRHLLTQPGLNYAGKVGISELALERAEGTEGTGDNRAALKLQEDLFRRNKHRIQKVLAQVNKQLHQRNSPAQRKRLLARQRHLQEELGSVEGNLSGVRGSLHELNAPVEVEGEEGPTPEQEAAEKLREAIEAQTRATEEQAQAEKEMKDELKRQTDFAQSATATNSATAWKALADILSGKLGPMAVTAGRTAGAGSVGRY